MFYPFLDDTNIWALAPLCQEYQVDWLSKKIEYLLRNCSTINTRKILSYLVLAEDMNFGIELERSLVYKLHRRFHYIGLYLEFLLLSRRIQVWIARKKLADLLKELWVDPYPSAIYTFSNEKRVAGIKDCEAVHTEILSLFDDLGQCNIELTYG